MSVSSAPVEADVEDIENETNENDESLGARLRGVFRAATSNGKVTFGLIIVGFFVLLALCSPLIVHSDASAFGPDISVSPSATHPLGTTSYGQDVLAAGHRRLTRVGGARLHHGDRRDNHLRDRRPCLGLYRRLDRRVVLGADQRLSGAAHAAAGDCPGGIPALQRAAHHRFRPHSHRLVLGSAECCARRRSRCAIASS